MVSEKMDFKLVIFDVDGTLTKEDNSWKLIHTSLNVFEKAKFSLRQHSLYIRKQAANKKGSGISERRFKTYQSF